MGRDASRRRLRRGGVSLASLPHATQWPARALSSGGTFNGDRQANPRLDARIDPARTEPDVGQRRVRVATALKLASDDIPYVPLYGRTLSGLKQKKVRAVVLPDDTIPVRWVNVRQRAKRFARQTWASDAPDFLNAHHAMPECRSGMPSAHSTEPWDVPTHQKGP